jgi:cytoskeletal protein CcmA (bactofilin family)
MWNRENTVKREETREPAIVTSISLPPAVEERRVVAWVGKSVIFKGTLISSEDMTIDGKVEGTIEVRDQVLTVGPDADIRAGIIAGTVTIHGAVTGNIRASEKIEIRSTGHIQGDLVAPRIHIADGAVVCGRVDTSKEQSDATKLRGKLAIV